MNKTSSKLVSIVKSFNKYIDDLAYKIEHDQVYKDLFLSVPVIGDKVLITIGDDSFMWKDKILTVAKVIPIRVGKPNRYRTIYSIHCDECYAFRFEAGDYKIINK